jgi:hypothetical protein
VIPVEKYIQARYHMYRQVYLHKTVTAAEAMLEALLRRAGDLLWAGENVGLDRETPLGRALTEPEALTLADFLELDDVEVFAQVKTWSRGEDPILRDIAGRLLARRLFKTITIDEAASKDEERFERASALVRAAGLDPRYYLLRVDSSDTPYSPYDLTAPRAVDHIFVEDGKGGTVDVAMLSPTVEAFTQSSYTLNRLVFADIEGDISLREQIEACYTSEL